MCGLTGIIDNRQAKKTDSSILNRMNSTLHHRGPDAGDIWMSDDRVCGLGHRRLSIIDLSPSGTQPMSTQDGRYSIVFNGEIYNFQSIKKVLENKGYHFRSGADTEVILYGYIEYGKDILQKLIGMWSFAIWDNSEKRLFAARDRVGIKPFYFYEKEGIFCFASEIKALFEHPDAPKDMNFKELPNYLNYGMSSKYESLFKDIMKLPSGCYLTYDSNSELKVKRYWQPLSKTNNDISFEEAGSEVLRLLRESVKSRMMSDVPFGVFLSGGIDSSLNVALMDELMDRPVDTYTVGFKELEKFNELKYARKVSDLFSTNHHEILIDDKDCKNVLETIAWHTDEPNGDPVCMPLYYLSKLTRDSGTTVIQVGEGSDEQFAGYEWMLQGYNFYNSYWKAYNTLPSFLRKGIYNSIKPIFKSANLDLPLEYLRRASYNEEFNWSGVPIFGPSAISEMKSDDRINEEIPYRYAKSLYDEINKIKPEAEYFQKTTYLEQQQRLAEILLMRVDKIGMAHSLEARVPFLDHRLVEFTSSLPDKIKVPDKKEAKSLLKKAITGILPDEIIYREKMGFAAPVNNWFREEWKPLAEHHLFHSEFAKSNIFNEKYLKRLMESNQKGKKRGSHIYSLVALSIWYDKYWG